MSDRYSRVLAAVRTAPEHTLIAVDFDGTLAPIVDDPAHAFAEPAAIEALARLGSRVGHLAIVTGRPVRTVLELGGFAGRRGFERLVVLGQYGVERWDARTETLVEPSPPSALAEVARRLPEVLAEVDASAAYVEDKGRALVVHTRRLPDPRAAFERLGRPLATLAERHGLVAEPGRLVWELRDGRVDKGAALAGLIASAGIATVVFAGDDLGDLPAFDAVDDHRAAGGEGLLVCSASTEQDALAARADVVVDGPLGLAVWLADLEAAL